MSKVDSVVSGTPYLVRLVGAVPPGCLADFVADDRLAMTIEREGQVVVVQGVAQDAGDTVVVYEKAGDGRGKDVRTWLVTSNGDEFTAAERSMF